MCSACHEGIHTHYVLLILYMYYGIVYMCVLYMILLLYCLLPLWFLYSFYFFWNKFCVSDIKVSTCTPAMTVPAEPLIHTCTCTTDSWSEWQCKQSVACVQLSVCYALSLQACSCSPPQCSTLHLVYSVLTELLLWQRFKFSSSTVPYLPHYTLWYHSYI